MEEFSSKCNDDTLAEILMRVDPCNIFNCILVSKDWLSMITDPVFRTNYLNRWRNSNSKVVGLLLYEHFGMFHRWPPGIQLLPTTNLGRNIKARRGSMLGGGIKFFLSKSPKGGLLLFGGVDPKRFYVCKPISEDPPLEIPPPPAHYEKCFANILSDDDDGEAFKVILVWNLGYDDDTTTRVGIQTYCSLSGNWEQQSTLTCSTLFSLFPSEVQGGILSRGGSVVYWAAVRNNKWCLAAWDMGNGNGISLISEPEPVVTLTVKYDRSYVDYGVLEGSLIAARCSVHISGTIDVWALDEDKKDWRLLYSERHQLIWTKNSSLLKPLFTDRHNKLGFTFVSFVPGKSDSIFLAFKEHLFFYRFQTKKLEYVEYLKYDFWFKRPDVEHDMGVNLSVENFTRLMFYHPLTVLDLGIWPSHPPALHLPRSS